MATRTSTTKRRRTKPGTTPTGELATVEIVDALNSRVDRRWAEHNAMLTSICGTLERLLDIVAPESASAPEPRPKLRVVGGTEA